MTLDVDIDSVNNVSTKAESRAAGVSAVIMIRGLGESAIDAQRLGRASCRPVDR